MLLPQLNIGEQAAEVGERSMKAAVEFVNKEVGGVGHLLLSCCCLRKHRPASRASADQPECSKDPRVLQK